MRLRQRFVAVAVMALVMQVCDGPLARSQSNSGVPAAGASNGLRRANQCFGSEQLRARRGEEIIRKMIPEAYQVPPDRRLAGYRKLTRLRDKVLRRVDLPENGRRLIALTFDLCEQPYEVAGYQGSVVDFLRGNSIKATFFAGGKWMLTHRQRAQQLISDPLFEVANHSWEHRNLRLLQGNDLSEEITNADLAYEEVRGELAGVCRTGFEATVPERMSLFRFPFGACNPAALHAVSEAGHIAVQWDVSSGDPTRGLRPDALVQQVVRNVRPGSIVLFHANGRGWSTSAALPEIVRQLQTQGYEFATVTDLLEEPGARPVYVDRCFDDKPGDTERYDDLSRRLEVAYQRFKKSRTDGADWQNGIGGVEPPGNSRP
jgi:peptidoglycan-N-acetylglucosamine deacetylase